MGPKPQPYGAGACFSGLEAFSETAESSFEFSCEFAGGEEAVLVVKGFVFGCFKRDSKGFSTCKLLSKPVLQGLNLS